MRRHVDLSRRCAGNAMVPPSLAHFMPDLRFFVSPLLLAAVSVQATSASAGAVVRPNLAAINAYTTSDEQVTSISQFADVRPTDWAYQALANLVERYGCVAGYPNGSFKGGQSLSRYEAAALLNACLDRVSETTDELKRLIQEFQKELAVLRGRVDGLEARVGELEANQFSTTTKLKGLATFVLGANSFSGSAINTGANSVNRRANELTGKPRSAVALPNATTFNYDVQLTFPPVSTAKTCCAPISGPATSATACLGVNPIPWAFRSSRSPIRRIAAPPIAAMSSRLTNSSINSRSAVASPPQLEPGSARKTCWLSGPVSTQPTAS
jgi:hypothetical protein